MSAAGIGLATSDPGRNEDGAARYGTLSGSSAAAALTAGAAALLAQARPDLDAAGLKQALVASTRRRGGGAAGLLDPSAAAAVELVADPPAVGLGVGARGEHDGPPPVDAAERQPARARADARARHGGCRGHRRRGRSRTARGSSPGHRCGSPSPQPCRCCRARLRRLGGALRIKVRGGTTLQIPWAIAVPPAKRDLIPVARLSSRTFAPSDAEPAVLTVVAGRVDGTAERPQLLAARAACDRALPGRARTSAGSRSCATCFPGRYSFGITGRGRGASDCRQGEYSLHLTATPIDGGATDEQVVPFTIS